MNTNINLLKLLETINEESIIIKIFDEFPDYQIGSDIDILVINKYDALNSLINYLKPLINKNLEEIHIEETKSHIHLDLFRKNKLVFRIDMIENFNSFSRFSIQDSLKTSMFLKRKKKWFLDKYIYVPVDEHEFLIRYLEYLEWFEIRPDKLKHYEFVINETDELQKNQLMKNLHRYIKFQRENSNQIEKEFNFTSRKKAFQEIFKLVKLIITITLRRN